MEGRKQEGEEGGREGREDEKHITSLGLIDET